MLTEISLKEQEEYQRINHQKNSFKAWKAIMQMHRAHEIFRSVQNIDLIQKSKENFKALLGRLKNLDGLSAEIL